MKNRGRIPWRVNQAHALGNALADGLDAGARVDAIFLFSREELEHARELALEAWAEGLRPALIIGEPDLMQRVRWPAGVPVYLVPPGKDANDAERFLDRVRPLLEVAKVTSWWPEAKASATGDAIGFRRDDTAARKR